MIAKPGISQQQPASAQRPAAGAQGIELVVARFLRALQVLLKSAQLYERNHPRLLESLDAAERNLRAALPLASPLGISVLGDALHWRGRAVADPRGELRTLASALARQGVSTLIFLPATNVGELGSLAELLDASRNPGSAADGHNWPALLEQRRIRGIRINAPLEEKKADAVLARLLAAVLDPSMPLWTRPDPSSGEAEDIGAPVVATTLDELVGVLHLLGKIAQPLRESYRQVGAIGSPAESQDAIQALRSKFAEANPRVLRILVKAMAHQGPQSGEALEPYVARLAESLVLEFACGQFSAPPATETSGNGRARPPEWRELFVVAGHALLDAGLTPACDLHDLPISSARWTEESCAEFLYERFWEEVPAQQKSAVLRSREAWCMPVPCLRAYLEQLAGGDSEAPRREARFILLNYARCLESEQATARLGVATGLSELQHLIESLWPDRLSEELSRCVLRALAQEAAPEVAGVLAAVTSNLARLAIRLADWAGFERIVDALDACPRDTEHAHLTALANRLLEGARWQALVEAGLANRPLDASLPRIVGRQPERLLDQLGARLAGPRGLEGLPAISRLIRAVGEPAIGALVARLFDPGTGRNIAAVKMLVATRPDRLVEALPRALPSWDWNVQDLAVGELVRLGTPGAAQAFLAALPQAHALVVPMMIDEIGLAKESAAVPSLMDIAAGRNARLKDVFVRIKAIEALGRVLSRGEPREQASEAANLLRAILRQRNGLTHSEPAGLRAAAEEALGLIENRPSSARVRTAQEAVQKASVAYARPRRYLRIPLGSPLAARIESPGHSSPSAEQGAERPAAARVTTISMGGAFLESSRRLNVGDSLSVEIRAGWRRIQSMAVVRNVMPGGGGIEFVHMKQEDRERLRRLVSRLMRS